MWFYDHCFSGRCGYYQLKYKGASKLLERDTCITAKGLNPGKCDIAVRKFKILNFESSTEGIRPDPKKLTAIGDMSRLKDVRDMCRFLSASTFNGFARLAAPLTSLIKKD